MNRPAPVRCSALLGGFAVTEETYPSGKKYLMVMRGKKRIGNCEQVAGGFLVCNKRKAVPTLLLAVKQMIDDGMNRARAEESRWQKLMCCLKNECGPIPPNAEVSDVCPPLASETEKPRTGTRSLH